MLLSCGTRQTADVTLPEQPRHDSNCVLAASDLEVHFQSPDGLWLEGTASFPQRGNTEELQVVVLAHPAGAQSRDGVTHGQWGLDFGFEIHVLQELARGLTQRGFVVLRFDKRSCTRANACGQNDYPPQAEPAHVFDLVDDLSSAISAAARLPGVHSHGVHLFGYGQSAAFVPSLLRHDRRVRSAVAFGFDTWHPGKASIERADRLEAIGTATGLSQAEVTEMATRTREFGWDLSELASLGPGGPAPIAERPQGFWIDTIQQYLRNLSPGQWSREKPLLLIFGDADWTTVADVEAMQRSILRSRANAVAVSLPHVTHALNRLEEDDPTRLMQEHIGRHIDPAVVNLIAQHFESNAPPRTGVLATTTDCRKQPMLAPLRLAHEGPLAEKATNKPCSIRDECRVRPLPWCKPGLRPVARDQWGSDGKRVSYAARIGVERGPVDLDSCTHGCCGGGEKRLDLRESLDGASVDFEFAGELGRVCNGETSSSCCPVPPHTKDGGGLVIATGVVRGNRLFEVQLCRPRPEHYGHVLNFDRGSPPLRSRATQRTP